MGWAVESVMESWSEEEDQFFDTQDELSSVSDSSSDCSEHFDSGSMFSGSLLGGFSYEVWIKNPGSIKERRNKFLKWMGLGVDRVVMGDGDNVSCNEVEIENSRITDNSNAVLRSSYFDDRISSSQSSTSCSSNDAHELLDVTSGENFVCRIRNLDSGAEFILDELEHGGELGRIREVGSDRLLTVAQFERTLELSPLVQRAKQRKVGQLPNVGPAKTWVKMGWLRRLGAAACIVDRQMEISCINYSPYPVARATNQIVRVCSYKKRSKEFSALYMRQDIPAHKGSILTMKFNPDGWYLASAGEDGVVRVWQVVELERSNKSSTVDIDSLHVYFMINNLSELVPLQMDKERNGNLKSLRATSDSTCVIFPHDVFQISEKPIHEFCGHCGEVLDLSWSKNKYLLSSSTDKTVRLWQVGYDHCLQVFFHNDYVTCVQFNPVDENYFVSGSIDGKVRIWAIPHRQVVDWIDIADIVTAVCYRPDGKGAIVGLMNGNCRFYDALVMRIALVNTNWCVFHGSDNRLQLCSQICLQSKTKSALKRITGFQFCPSDPTKLMVTSADSHVRILQGSDVVCKYRGFHNAGSQISASFTSDGMHIISASEDSNVHVWNHSSQDGPLPQVKSTWSCERFFSNNASVAIPWNGVTCGNTISSNISQLSAFVINSGRFGQRKLSQYELAESPQRKFPFSSPDHFSVTHGFFSESLSKGSATWPEEKLPPNALVVSPAMGKSQHKFLKTCCQSMLGSPHAWGLVIVTAGWDGRIRSFQNLGLPLRL